MMNASATTVRAGDGGSGLGPNGAVCVHLGPCVRSTQVNHRASRFPIRRHADLGHGRITPATKRYFKVLYRDNNVFCKLHSFNMTNGVAVTFVP